MLPYFDVLFEKLNSKNRTAKEAFSDYVHWGYWERSPAQKVTAKDFHNAALLMTKRVISNAQIKDGYKVLDVGCGFGGTIKLLNETHNNCEFTGINIDPRQLEVARKNVIAKNNNKVEFIEADACNISIHEKQFDVILCVESIFHFSDREIFFKECNRLLKPGGTLIVSDFVPLHILNSFLNFIEHAFHLVDKVYGTMRIDISVLKYKKMAQKTGFDTVAVEDITKHTFPTYTFLKESFSLHLSKEERRFRNATMLIEYASKFGLLKYLILSFKKNGNH